MLIKSLLYSSLCLPNNSLNQANEDEDSQDSNWLAHMGSVAVNQQSNTVGNNGAPSSSEVRSHISKLASIDSFDSKW
jgi:3-phosphoinositide dependent protein kinase-1